MIQSLNSGDHITIRLFGNEEHGICIGFRDKKFLGIESQDWTL